MKFRAVICFFLCALPLALHGAEESAAPPPARPLWKKLLNPFGGPKKSKEAKARGTNFKQLEMGLKVEPDPVKVPETRQMKVTLTLTNRGGKLAQLEFPNSQRVEVLLKSKSGQAIEQWSQDQAFTNEPTLVTINPRERLEYSVSVSTREMTAGETYTVEAFFPNFDALRKTHTITAEK